MSLAIEPYTRNRLDELLALSERAWRPVFDKLPTAAPDFVLEAFYPAGWWARQRADICRLLAADDCEVWLALDRGALCGFIGLRRFREDCMGEIHILAVDPLHQRRGVGSALMQFAFDHFKVEGFSMVMVETGDDPGHAPSRATYEAAGFQRWPVARYFRKL